MSRIFPLIGFFLPMLMSVTADHLIKQGGLGEFVDSIFTALFFTAIFVLGVRLGSSPGKPQGMRFLDGLVAGVIVQATIWGFWLSIPHAIRYSFGAWPLLAHVLLIGGTGYALRRSIGSEKRG